MSDNRILKASFRECPISDRKQFLKSTCIIPISVGQPIHEGQKFVAAIKLINASFKSCTILVDDSVQRHTMAISNSADADRLYELAVQEGSDWLKRNESGYQQLTIPYNIMRWDDWLNSKPFEESYRRVKQYYSENVHFQHAIQANIESFLSRYFARLEDTSSSSIDPSRAFSLCLDYLLEECAVMCLWVEGNYAFEVYPSGRNEAMAATYKHLIEPFHSNLLKPVALRFKKYPGNTPSKSLHIPKTRVEEQ